MKKHLYILAMVAFLAGVVQADTVVTNLNIAAAGSYYPGTVVLTSQSYNGATFDIAYTLEAAGSGTNPYIYSDGSAMGVGSDSDAQDTTMDGDTGDGMSFTGLSITNFNANGSGVEIGDITDLRFTVLSLIYVGNARDGITVSFTDYSTSSVNYALDSTGTGGISGDTPYPLDLTALANYDATATGLYIENDSANGSDRWSVNGIGVSYSASFTPKVRVIGISTH